MQKFRVEVVAKTDKPQQVIYGAMHQDYSEDFVFDSRDKWPSESKCGEILVKRLLAGNRGHYGPFEHSTIVFNCGFFPHSVMQQVRTHRHLSFDVQSNRYTGDRIVDVGVGRRDIEDVFYLRPVGRYTNRHGGWYEYTPDQRHLDLAFCDVAVKHYCYMLGMAVLEGDLAAPSLSHEHARNTMPFDVRQHWIMSMNARSLMHLLDMRWKKDAQLECQQLCELIWPHFEEWMPEVASWYLENQAKKARLAP